MVYQEYIRCKHLSEFKPFLTKTFKLYVTTSSIMLSCYKHNDTKLLTISIKLHIQ